MNNGFTDRHDSEFTDTAAEWAEEGCLPETSDIEEDLAKMAQVVKMAPEERRQDVVDLITARAILARETNRLSEDVCVRVLEVLGVPDSEETKERVLKLVQSA